MIFLLGRMLCYYKTIFFVRQKKEMLILPYNHIPYQRPLTSMKLMYNLMYRQKAFINVCEERNYSHTTQQR